MAETRSLESYIWLCKREAARRRHWMSMQSPNGWPQAERRKPPDGPCARPAGGLVRGLHALGPGLAYHGTIRSSTGTGLGSRPTRRDEATNQGRLCKLRCEASCGACRLPGLPRAAPRVVSGSSQFGAWLDMVSHSSPHAWHDLGLCECGERCVQPFSRRVVQTMALSAVWCLRHRSPLARHDTNHVDSMVL